MSNRVLGLFIALITCVLVQTPLALAADNVAIFDVRKTLPLDPSEPVFHDYYLNAGPEAGLKKGMFVSVVRRTPIHDPVQNKAQGTLSVEVAKLQIIHTERNISVGRMVTSFGSADRPVMDFEGIMIGDILDLTTISMDAPKAKRAAFRPEPVAPQTTTDVGTTENSSVDPGTVSIPVPAPQPRSEKGAEAVPLEHVETPTDVQSAENEFPVWAAPVMVHALNDESDIYY